MSVGSNSQKKGWDPCEWAGVESAWELAEVAIAKLSRVFLWGPPGVGKSFLAFQAGKASPVQVTLAEDLTVQELMGHWVPDRIEWHFHLGPVSRAYRDGGILVLNEIGRASGSVQDFLLAVLDTRDVASMALPIGEITPAQGFKVIGTSNTNPDQLDPALRSRFEAEIHLRVPNTHLIVELDRRCQGLGAAIADSYLDPERALDPRRVVSFVNLISQHVPVRQAAVLTLADRAPDFLSALQARGVRLPCDNF
jgi:MoxR-like ATPase